MSSFIRFPSTTSQWINLALLKKASGYRPFLYNFTLDFCQFMRNKRTNPFLKICIERLLEDSNINHTCPYDNDIILRNLYFTQKHFELLPRPLGDYLFHIKIAAYNEWKADIKIYITNY